MKIKAAQYIADFLSAKGIETVFSVTGGGAMHMNDAFGHHERINVVYNHHEQACAFGAEGYARAVGRPAAVCVTSGPGGTNAITGVMGSWLDSIPVFVVSGQVKYSTTMASVPHLKLRHLGDQEFNIVDSIRCMTKYSHMITDESELAYHLEKAWFYMTDGRPGPVWLDIPLNIQGAMIETDDLKHFTPDKDEIFTTEEFTVADAEALLNDIKNAHAPVIFAGTAIRNNGYTDKFIEFAERLNIPVVTAWNAHDTLSDDHRLYCGRPGTVGTRAGNFVVQNSDLLLVIGSQLNIRQISYNYENFADKAKLYLVDFDSNEIAKPTINVYKSYRCDLRDFIDTCLELKDFYCDNHAKWLDWSKDICDKYSVNKTVKRDNKINPYEFMAAFSAKLDNTDTIVCSNGSACVITFQAFKVKQGQRMFTNSGCASMGYGLPAAIGAAVANKEGRIICLEGDGSLQMNIQELATAHNYTPNLKLLVINNNGYHSMRQTQLNLFKGRPLCGVNEDNGVWIPPLDKIADAYSMDYYRVTQECEYAAIDEFLSDANAAILEVFVDENQFFEPKLSSKVLPDGRIESPPIQDMYPFLDREEYDSIKFE